MITQRLPQQHLIIYAKRPRPGYAKTRLAAAIGAEQAAGFYARLLYAYLFDMLSAAFEDTTIELSLTATRDVAYFAKAFPELYVTSQIEGDLGTRMHASFQCAFAHGATRAVLTGSDIPGLDAILVGEAFAVLEHQPAVIGPAADGGYYLIGMRAPGANLFRDIAWSTDSVLAQTEAQAQSQGLALTRLRTLVDIDTGDDYRAWRADTNEDVL